MVTGSGRPTHAPASAARQDEPEQKMMNLARVETVTHTRGTTIELRLEDIE
jgi:hypothetical protein